LAKKLFTIPFLTNEIKVKSIKTDGTIVEQQALTVLVDPAGYVFDKNTKNRIVNAEVALFEKDNEGKWKMWDASKYSQANPQNTNKGGEYGFMTPAGRYYISVTAPGYKDYKSEEITVKQDPITLNISLEPEKNPSFIQRNLAWLVSGILGLVALFALGYVIIEKRKSL